MTSDANQPKVHGYGADVDGRFREGWINPKRTIYNKPKDNRLIMAIAIVCVFFWIVYALIITLGLAGDPITATLKAVFWAITGSAMMREWREVANE